MRETVILFISIIFINNIVLQQFLGICPFVGASKKIENILGFGLAITFITALTGIFTYLVYYFILLPAGIGFLKIIVFILIIISLVKIIDIIIQKTVPVLYNFIGIYFPVLSVNCLVVGIAVINIDKHFSFISSIYNSIACGIGYLLVLFIMSTIREKLELSNVPKAFQGIPITLISAGLMVLAFMAFDKTMLIFLEKLF